MPKKLNVAPTKSNYLSLTRQLAFARDGYDLLEQKRQILVFELMSRLGRAKDVERRVREALGPAHDALRKSTLDIGAAALDSVTMAIGERHEVSMGEQNVMGIRVPTLSLESRDATMPFGVGGTSADTDVALRRFTDVIPLLIELAEISSAVLRLARELRKTQRRCNALNRIFIPEYKATTDYITASLEERERENFVILRMVKERLARTSEGETKDVVRQ
ncbi:MAG: V-type ATP synthase subunit D [Kiritimatiellae bacterium]|nr:V-type ATP synthase subunit D [Kiritimatiellia bacterium]